MNYLLVEAIWLPIVLLPELSSLQGTAAHAGTAGRRTRGTEPDRKGNIQLKVRTNKVKVNNTLLIDLRFVYAFITGDFYSIQIRVTVEQVVGFLKGQPFALSFVSLDTKSYC